MADGFEETEGKTCAFFLKRKNRFCRMTVGEGRKYCGEHMVVAGEAEVRKGCFCTCQSDIFLVALFHSAQLCDLVHFISFVIG